MYEVAEDFYAKLIPQARALAARAASRGRPDAARAVNAAIDAVLARPEHAWFTAEQAKHAPPGR
jgi:hydroxylamine dehydrogenase